MQVSLPIERIVKYFMFPSCSFLMLAHDCIVEQSGGSAISDMESKMTRLTSRLTPLLPFFT